jgi:thiamine biosynthesis lipoprotein
VLARGTCPGTDRSGWSIGLPHPLRHDERLGEVMLENEAIGTSGSATQSFEHEGRRYGHLIDPRTGQPVTGIYTATAVAPSAAEADALSTAFYVMTSAQVERFCQDRPDIAAILVRPRSSDAGGSDVDVEVLSFGLRDRLRNPLANS